VREINLKARTLIIPKQFIQPSWGLYPDPADNRFRLSAHCANEPQRLFGHYGERQQDGEGCELKWVSWTYLRILARWVRSALDRRRRIVCPSRPAYSGTGRRTQDTTRCCSYRQRYIGTATRHRCKPSSVKTLSSDRTLRPSNLLCTQSHSL